MFGQNDTISNNVDETLTAEDIKLFKEFQIDDELFQLEIDNFLYIQVDNIKETNELRQLKNKLGSELNNIVSCCKYFIYSNHLQLSEKEIILLKIQMENVANKLFESKKYILVELTGGMSPISGVKTEEQYNKKVNIIMLGRDCLVDEYDIKEKEIYNIFNQAMIKRLDR